jgi:hypothetical protein
MAIVISQNGKNAKKIEPSTFEKEDHLQKYIYDNPESIPLYEIKEDIHLLILAREFPTHSGPIDAIGIDKDGEIYIIETKLYKNPDKRTVLAQALDYGAALWKHSYDFTGFINLLDQQVRKAFGMSLDEKIQEYFGLSGEEELVQLRNALSINLNGGILHFVVLMDNLDLRLKDLILYVNQNSKFDVYAVELEYYKHDTLEIVIPRIYGTEVKKEIQSKNVNSKLWNWELFKDRLKESGDEAVDVAKQIIDWANLHDVEISWGSNQMGSFIMGFYAPGKKGFYPFSVTGYANLSWNAPHQGNYSPSPFDNLEKRKEILKRLNKIEGSAVNLNNVDGYSGLKLSLRTLANQEALQIFFDVCLWIKETLE